MKKSLFLLAILAIIFQSCKKDGPITPDPDPAIALLTSQAWKVFTSTDELPPDCQLDDVLTFNSDGTLSYVINTSCGTEHADFTGSWMITDAKKEVTYKLGDKSQTFTILYVDEHRLELLLDNNFYFVYMHNNTPSPLTNKTLLTNKTWKAYTYFGRLPEACEKDDTFVFNADGSFTYNLGEACATSNPTGTWELNENVNKITIKNNGEIVSIYSIRNIAKNRLDLHDIYEETNYVFE